MEPNTPDSPLTPQNETSPTITPPNPAEPSKKPRSKKLLFIVLGVLGLLLIAGLIIILFSSKTYNDNASQTDNTHPEAASEPAIKETEQVLINPIDKAQVTLKQTEYYAVTINDSQTYYGNVYKINDDYIRITPLVYKKSAALLTNGGSELHGPESGSYIRIAKITKLQSLNTSTTPDDKTIIDHLKANPSTLSDAYPQTDINKYLKSEQFQAFFFADGTAFFAKTTSLDGKFLANSSHVYILKSEQQVQPSGTSSTQATLALAKPDLYNTLTTADLLYWQNMKQDSQISKAATEFEKNQ